MMNIHTTTSYSAFAYKRKTRRREGIGREQTKARSGLLLWKKKYAIAFGNKNKWIKTITRCAKSDALAALTTSEQKVAPRPRTRKIPSARR